MWQWSSSTVRACTRPDSCYISYRHDLCSNADEHNPSLRVNSLITNTTQSNMAKRGGGGAGIRVRSGQKWLRTTGLNGWMNTGMNDSNNHSVFMLWFFIPFFLGFSPFFVPCSHFIFVCVCVCVCVCTCAYLSLSGLLSVCIFVLLLSAFLNMGEYSATEFFICYCLHTD